ncbi:MAG: MFS transporter [Clostridiales bacterium]
MKKLKEFNIVLKKSNKSVLLLIGGQSISRLGDSIQLVDLFWLVYELTGSEGLTSMIALCNILPVVLLGFYCGAVVDKYNRKIILIFSDTVQSILYILVPVLYYMNLLKVQLLFIIIFIIGISRAFFYPTLRAILPSIVEKEHFASVNSVNTILTQAASMIGPVIAGFLTYYIGSINLFILNSLTFLVSIITILKLTFKNNQLKSASCKDSEDEKIITVIMKGFRYVYHKKMIFYLILIFPLFTIITAGLTDIALLPYVKKVLLGSSIEYGLLQTCISIGVFIGGFLTIKLTKWNKFTLFLSGIVIVGVDFILFGINSHIYFALLLMILLGLAFVLLEVCMVTLIQENVKENMLGRVFSLWSVMGTTGDAFSYMYIAGVLSIISVQESFILGGSILFIGGMIGFWQKFKFISYIKHSRNL